MTWTGGCLCGRLRYRADAEPVRAVICHCSICRRVSGAPMLCFVHFLVVPYGLMYIDPFIIQNPAIDIGQTDDSISCLKQESGPMEPTFPNP